MQTVYEIFIQKMEEPTHKVSPKAMLGILSGAIKADLKTQYETFQSMFSSVNMLFLSSMDFFFLVREMSFSEIAEVFQNNARQDEDLDYYDNNTAYVLISFDSGRYLINFYKRDMEHYIFEKLEDAKADILQSIYEDL